MIACDIKIGDVVYYGRPMTRGKKYAKVYHVGPIKNQSGKWIGEYGWVWGKWVESSSDALSTVYSCHSAFDSHDFGYMHASDLHLLHLIEGGDTYEEQRQRREREGESYQETRSEEEEDGIPW